MTDFYKELGDFLNPQMSQQEILTELKKQKAIWHRREITGGDQAKAKSLLINQALEVFATEESRKKYDKELEESKREEPQSQVEEVDYEKEREENFLEWANKAIQFLEIGQYDIAKEAFEKAEKYQDPKQPNLSFFYLGIEIYDKSRNPEKALYCANQILLYDPEDPLAYINKAIFLFRIGEKYFSNKMNNEGAVYQKDGMRAADMAVKCAQKQNDNKTLGRAMGCSLYISYFQRFSSLRSESDWITLEKEVKEVLQLAPEDDFSQAVLADLKKKGRTKEQIDEKRRIAEEKERAWEEKKRAWEEAKRQDEARRKEEKERAEEEARKKAEEARRREEKERAEKEARRRAAKEWAEEEARKKTEKERAEEEARKKAEEEKKRKRKNFLSVVTIIHVLVMFFMCRYVYNLHTEFPLTHLWTEGTFNFEQIFGAKWMVFIPGICMLVSRLTDWFDCIPKTEFIHAIDIILYLVAGYYLNIISIIPYGITYDKDGVVYALLLNGCLLALPLLILGISTMIRNFIADKSGFNRRH